MVACRGLRDMGREGGAPWGSGFAVCERVCSVGCKRTSTSPVSWPLIARGRERVAGLAAKRTFTIPAPWPLNPQVVNELLWVAAKRTFTSPGLWPLCYHSWLSYLPYYQRFHRWPRGVDAARAQQRRAPARSLVGTVESSASVDACLVVRRDPCGGDDANTRGSTNRCGERAGGGTS